MNSNGTSKIIAGGVIVAAILAYIVFINKGTGASTDTAINTTTDTGTQTPIDTTTSTTDTSGSANPPPSGGNGTTPTPSPTPTGKFKNGTYAGSVADAVYGPMQVQAVISGGKLTDVKFLQFPSSPGHTTEVSGFALPQLRQEAIAAQSAQVDIVSGATQDTEAFIESLGTALTQAQA